MRKTTAADAPRLVEFMFAYFIEAQKTMKMKVSMDLLAVRSFFENALAHPDLISYISEDGVILGELGRLWWGAERVARGVLWYVKPEARNGLLARRLLMAFDGEAKARGAVYSKMDLDNPAQGDVIDGLYKLAAYHEFSKSYVKEF